MIEQIKKEFADDFSDYLKNLEKLIKIPSVSTNKQMVTKALATYLDIAKSFGLNAYDVCDKQIGIVEYGQGEKEYGILVHLDVVDVKEQFWDTNPFTLVEDDEKLIARGVLDGKGPALLFLYILKYFKERNYLAKDRIKIIIGTQEEVMWNDIDEYKANYQLPDYGFAVDGLFPIQNAEKGYVDIAFEFDGLGIDNLKAGSATNMIPNEFIATIDEQVYEYEGKAFHSSFPEMGINAILKGSQELAKISPHFIFDFINDYLSDPYGSKFDLKQDGVVNEDYSNQTTLVPTVIEQANQDIFLSVNVRTAFENTYEKLIAKLDAIKDDYQFEYHVFDYRPPFYIDPKTPFVQKLASAYEQATNDEATFIFASKTSYAKAMPNLVCFGPLNHLLPDSTHQPNEFWLKDDLARTFNIYLAALANI